jgi:taurine dioxygenase
VSAGAATLDVVKLAPHIGAEVRGLDLARDLTPATVAALNKLWLEHIVLVFRGQQLDQAQLLKVTAGFGEIGKLHRPKNEFPKAYGRLLDNIMLISNIREDGEPIGALPDGEMMFHHDTIHAEIPAKGTLLYSVEIPTYGGNTLFANGYAAYDAIPREVRDRLEGRRARHRYNYGSVQKGDGKGTVSFGECEHPVFRTHDETGRKAVYVNRLMTEEVIGLPKEESDHLLSVVYDCAENPDFVYEHAWRVGDLVIWDNRCSSHARRDFPAGQRRLMLRTTLQGESRPL